MGADRPVGDDDRALRRPGRRKQNGEGNTRRRRDGRFEGRIYVVTTDGREIRKSIYGSTFEDVHQQVTQLKAQAMIGPRMTTTSQPVGECQARGVIHRRRTVRRRFERAKALSSDRIVDVAALDQDLADDETTLVISDWRFTGTGWITEGDAVVAVEASATAREYANAKGSARSCAVSGTTKMEETCGKAC